MKTIYQLQQIAARLREVTEVNSISPEDTFGLQADVLEYLADMEQNAEGLGIHKVYASYAAMVADASAPVGSNGKALRFGQLVVIYDSSNTTQAESGNVYAWQKGQTGASAWKLMGNLGNVHALQSQIDSLLSSDESMKGKLTDLEEKTDDISKEIIETEDESIAIEDNNGNVLANITSDSSSFKNLKNNGKDVLTEHQDISGLATKKDLDGIEHESVAEEEEEVVFEEEDGNFCARVNHRGVDSVGYALNGNPITKTHEPSNQCKGLTHYYHEGGDTIQYSYDFTEDSYIIHNPNGVNGNIYAEIVGLKAGKTYRISGIGSGITSTKRICASNVVSGLNNTIAELEDNGEGIYSAEFTILENTITTINIAPRYNSKLTSFTNIKVIEVPDVERSVLVNNFVDNISIEELSYALKKHLSIDENPTTYCGRSACVFNNVLFIGDSLTEGAFNKKGTNGMSDASGSFYRQEYSYPSFFKKLTGANGENWGLGGHTTNEWWNTRTTEGSPNYKSDEQWSGFDCAIIALGTNDAFRASSASDTITALNNIIDKLLLLNNRISIFVATPFGGRFALDSKFTEVSDTIRNVVNGRTDCYLLDINRYGHMNEKRGYNAGHFTAIGYERLAEDIINYMSWIIDSNDWDFKHVQFSNTDYEPFN